MFKLNIDKKIYKMNTIGSKIISKFFGLTK